MSYVKGDTIQLSITVDDDITDWKIRAEIYDDSGISIQLANLASGGSDAQIAISSATATKSVFLIKVPKGETTNINDTGYLEIEVDTGEDVGGSTEQLTILPKMSLSFKDEQITWTTPDE